MKRQRVKSARFDLATLQPTGVGARGTRLAAKAVARLKHTEPKAGASKPSKKRRRAPEQRRLF